MHGSRVLRSKRVASLGTLALFVSFGLGACAQRDLQTLALRDRIAQGALAPEDVPHFRTSPQELRAMSDALRDRPQPSDSAIDQALLEAARKGDASELRRQVQAGAKVNGLDALGNTALTYAAAAGDLVLVRMLLKEGADVDGRAAALTPLSSATLNGRVQVVKLLLSRGADPDATGLNGVVPLVLAVRMNQLATADALLQAGARADVRDRSGDHLLMLAISNDLPAMTDLLLRRGMNPNMADRDGLTPLYWARQLGRETISKRLEQAGAQEEGLQVRESREYSMGDS
jgi:uncharacterized protein